VETFHHLSGRGLPLKDGQHLAVKKELKR